MQRRPVRILAIVDQHDDLNGASVPGGNRNPEASEPAGVSHPQLTVDHHSTGVLHRVEHQLVCGAVHDVGDRPQGRKAATAGVGRGCVPAAGHGHRIVEADRVDIHVVRVGLADEHEVPEAIERNHLPSEMLRHTTSHRTQRLLNDVCAPRCRPVDGSVLAGETDRRVAVTGETDRRVAVAGAAERRVLVGVI